MRRLYTPVSVLLVGLVLGACARSDAAGRPAESETGLKDTILTLAREYNEAWGSLDVGAIVRFHGEGFEYYWFDESISADFPETVGEIWLAETEAYSIEMIDPSVEILGQDAAVISFRFRDRQLYDSGDEVTTQGALAYILERRSGSWEIVRIHHSGPVPEEYR